MTEKLDYKAIGLKCGIEIHQRLDTAKLFCSCPSIMIEDENGVEVKKIRRNMRAVAGETGTVDAAAKHEMETGTYYIYHAYPATTCLVELDEEPPHPMNPEALRTVLQVCKMLNMNIVDEVQVMRKTVANGSNTTGFQRTSLVGTGGYMEVDGKRVGIPTVMIEEEAAKDIEKGVDKDGRRYITYGLDRLGIPLIEIGTDPDIDSPSMCKNASEKIGMILRSTGKVARGIGTIRQDLNVSVIGGARVEIKGAQDLKMIPLWVENEARRQLALIDIRDELLKKRAELCENEVFLSSVTVTDTFKQTGCKFVNSAISKGSDVVAFKIEGFAGLLGRETQPGKRLGSELSDYAKVKTGIGGIIHSDEKLDKYKFTDAEIDAVKKALDIGENDAFAMIVSDINTAESAIKVIEARLNTCFEGIPGEVRKPNPDGTSSYMRPIPGAARMYPETDIKPIKPDVSGIKLPELLTDAKDRVKEKYGVSEDLARDLTKSGKHELFEDYVSRFGNVKPAFIAETMLSTPKILRRKYKVDETVLTDDDFEKIFSLLHEGKLTKDPVEDILVAICKGEKVDYSKYAPLTEAELEAEIKKVMKESEGIEFKMLIGKVMGTLKGRAEGKKIMEMLKRLNG